MKIQRSVRSVWANVADEQKDSGVPEKKWKQSYDGVKAALKSIRLIMVTTREEFEKLKIPKTSDGRLAYLHREITVSRDGIVSKPVRIVSLFTGNAALYTEDELNAVNREKSIKSIDRYKKGGPIHNKIESETIDRLDNLIDVKLYFKRQHLIEFRLCDIAYAKLQNDDDEIWIGEQIKTATATTQGRCVYSIQIDRMLSYLEKHINLVFIGSERESKEVEVVWYFSGQQAIDMLKKFDRKQLFSPMLYPKRKSNNQFTKAYSDTIFRYDVSDINERKRLLKKKISVYNACKKLTINYLNSDPSQIPSFSHRVEEISYQVTKKACELLNVTVERHHNDAYSSVDFRVDGRVGVQDKVWGKTFVMKYPGNYPYNPDNIDILQITNIETSVVYAIPMRVESSNNKIKSTFTADELMKYSVNLCAKWQKKHHKYICDLSSHIGIKKYLEICKKAGKTPKLSDEEFYIRILQEFGSKFWSSGRKSKKN